MGTSSEEVFNFIKETGPVLPSTVAEKFAMNTLFASAFLSELSSKGRVLVSSIKVGGSPLYYLPEHKEKLAEYKDNLHEKEQRTFEMLRSLMVVEDIKLELLDRVALRKMKDYAVALNVTIGFQTRLFWKFFTVTDEVASEVISKILQEEALSQSMQKEPQSKQQVEQDESEEVEEVEEEQPEEVTIKAEDNRYSEQKQDTVSSPNVFSQASQMQQPQQTTASNSNQYSQQATESDSNNNSQSQYQIPIERESNTSTNSYQTEKSPPVMTSDLSALHKPEYQSPLQNQQTTNVSSPSEIHKPIVNEPKQDVQKTTRQDVPQRKIQSSNQSKNKQATIEPYRIEPEDMDYYSILETDAFGKLIADYFRKKEIILIFSEIQKKNSDIFGILTVPSAIGELEYFFYAKKKKSITEKDIKEAYAESIILGYPLLYIGYGNLSKNAVIFSDSKLKGSKIIELN